MFIGESKNMNLGIDISQIAHAGTGVSRFTRGLVNSILRYDKKNKWTFLFYSLRKSLEKELENGIRAKGHKLIVWKIPPTIVSIVSNHFRTATAFILKNLPALNRLDYFITSDWIEIPINAKRVTVIHDLAYFRYPETFPDSIVNTQKNRLKWIKKESNSVVTDSSATKNDLQTLLGFPEKNIKTIYPGVEVVTPDEKTITNVLKNYNLAKPFILTVGKIEPRKNMKRLADAFVKSKLRDINLVIVGMKGWSTYDLSIDRYIEKKNIKLLGYVDDISLFSLYRSCLFFVYPSIWEGFGYPVIEAMKSGAPVATSNVSSLKEIGEDAALLFNPLDVDEITDSLRQMFQNVSLRKHLSTKGLEKSKQFTWKRYYDEMMKLFK